MFSQQIQILIFKSLTQMMCHLILNVLHHAIFLRDTHRECAVAVLPSELFTLAAGVVDMFACVAFQRPNKICDGDLSGNADKQMSVVIEAANLDGRAFKFPARPGHIGEHFLAETIRQSQLAILRAEDNVIQQLLMSTHACHFLTMCVGPPGLNRKRVSMNSVIAATLELNRTSTFNKSALATTIQFEHHLRFRAEARHIQCRWRKPPESFKRD